MRQIPLILLATAMFAVEGEGPPPGGPSGQDRRPPGPSPEEMFQKADADKDGTVTLAELTVAIESRMKTERESVFAKIDTNGDGQVSKDEFLAFEPPAPPGEDGQKKRRGPDPAEMFKRLDRNGDGEVTADEVKRPGKGDRPRDGKEPKEPKEPKADPLQ